MSAHVDNVVHTTAPIVANRTYLRSFAIEALEVAQPTAALTAESAGCCSNTVDLPLQALVERNEGNDGSRGTPSGADISPAEGATRFKDVDATAALTGSSSAGAVEGFSPNANTLRIRLAAGYGTE